MLKQQNYIKWMLNTQKLVGPKYFGTSKKRSIFDEGEKQVPGPGAYDNHNVNIKTKSPQWPLGTDQNRNGFLYSTPLDNPSPQKYKINYQATQKKSKKMTIPQSQHQFLNNTNPNFYDSIYDLSKPKSSDYSFGYYFGNNYGTLAPGPGQYDHEKPKLKKNMYVYSQNRKNGFSSSIRPQPYGQEGKNPGPGQYLTSKLQKGQKSSFPKGTRSQPKINDPPAQFYDLGVVKRALKAFRGPSSSQVHHQKEIIKESEYPAPNAYTCALKVKVQGGAMDKSMRPPVQNTQILKFPDSTKYETNVSDLDKKKVSFAKQIRRPQLPDQNIPGPKYSLADTFTNIGTKISRRHHNIQKSQNQPSAASYDPKDESIRRKAQSSIVFNADRIDFSKTITGSIGPGHYDNSQNYKSCFGKMSKAERKNQTFKDQNPGVGNYQIPNGIGTLPSYCKSPKKLSQTGFSVFYEKMQTKLTRQKMKKVKDSSASHQVSKQSESINPQEPIIVNFL